MYRTPLMIVDAASVSGWLAQENLLPRESSFLTFFVPTLLPIGAVSIVVFVAIDLGLSRAGIYRAVWHPPLFRASLFATLFGCAALLMNFGGT